MLPCTFASEAEFREEAQECPSIYIQHHLHPQLPREVPVVVLLKGSMEYIHRPHGSRWLGSNVEHTFMHLSSFFRSSGFDKDKLKKVIDEVTCWVALAEEKDSMVLHDIYGRKYITC